MTPFVQFGIQWKRGLAVSKRWVMHRRVVGSLLLLLTPLLVPEAWGATRYVSKSGTDNPTCTQAAPCRSIQHAVDIAIAGDTVSIGDGKFAESSGVIINKDLTVNGTGIFSTRVHGAWPGFSIFHVMSWATVKITDLDVMFGNAMYGGGILNSGNLTLKRVRVWKNSAKVGGGIYNGSGAALFIDKSEIAHNLASDQMGGGGLHNQGDAELNDVRVVKNHATVGGGGVRNYSNGSLIATGSEISHSDGIGIINDGSMSLINTTVSRNNQLGIYTDDWAHTELIHVTVAENGNGPTLAPDYARGGIQGSTDSNIVLVNTIVANNAPVQCIFPPLPFSPSSTNSLSNDMTCQLSPGSIAPVDPKLGPLKWNGGYTLTHALKPGSPAIDAGWPAECELEDQRGVSRLIDGNGDGAPNCDIGAFEYKPKVLEQPH
ncbi:MAG: hypothetical protein F9K13_10865 [Candidatus Methylomirabilis oxygeniifera]|uniref:Right handed beta helix domain-containing protein n=1 Tax=Methylomirabilis oxygeniifera TaxID=671143 RepID=D5MJN3_METO1|nr:MAG: hypothetical protein F9K13_10865 [Candidatus Methylomirabilis oxyfera]CBE69618.1 exported protein of unknown function [Candidatus Methylomirabilis oxyfera]